MAAIKFYMEVLRNYGNGNGRASRSEYWYFYLVYLILSLPVAVLSAVLGAAGVSIVGTILFGGYIVFHIIPSWTVAVRRLHDTGRSGWWLAMPGLPVVASIVLGTIAQATRSSSLWLLLAALIMSLATIGCGVVVIVFLAQRSVDDNNDYGRPPRTLEQL